MFSGRAAVNYELDLYDCSDERNPRSLHKLNCNLTLNDRVDGLVQLKFAKGIPVQANVKYALVCRTSACLTGYGHGGLPTVNGPDGTKFDFINDRHFNPSGGRTSTSVGQLPQILYGIENGKQIQVSFKSCELS